MKRQVQITLEPIDEQALLGQSLDPKFGAVIRFLGVVRAEEAGEQIRGLEYEAFERMAYHQFDLILNTIETRWPIASIHLIHRIGFVRAGEPSLWVQVTAPHRSEAFAACQHLIDEMKRVVPIWKRTVT